MMKGNKTGMSVIGVLAVMLFLLVPLTCLALTLDDPGSFLSKGSVQGRGTVFRVVDSNYFNVEIVSPVEIVASVHSGWQMIIFDITPVSPVPFVELTVSGMAPLTTYYLYQDGYENLLEVTTDTAGSFTYTQDLTIRHIIYLQPRRSTVFLLDNATGGDCANYGQWDSATKTCTLGVDLGESIQVVDGGLTLDGNGHRIAGFGTGSGILAIGVSGVTIRNLIVEDFWYGINFRDCVSVAVQNCNLNRNGASGWNPAAGVYFDNTSGSSVTGCTMNGNFHGICIRDSRGSGNTVAGNTILSSVESGVYLWDSTNNIVENNFLDSNRGGVFIYGGQANTIRANEIRTLLPGHGLGVWSGGNTVIGNNVSGYHAGLYFLGSYNTAYDNTMTANQIGICFRLGAAYNTIYHNNVMGNKYMQVVGDDWPTVNTFDLGPSVGGNYFGDWTAPDENNDGYVDSPYIITDENRNIRGQDNYPFTTPFGWLKNRPPVLVPIGNRTGVEGQLLEVNLTATDPDGDALTFSASNLPPGATFDAAAARFAWIPGFDQAGVYENVEFSVTDDGSPIEVDAELVTFTVGNVNRPPVVNPVGSLSVNEFQPVEFTVTASDPDGDDLTVYAGLLPAGSGFNEATGRFTWIPDASQTGNHTVTFYALDNGVPPLTGETSVQIAVADVPPAQQAGDLIDVIVGDNLPTEVENSYLANLKKVSIFVNDGKILPAVNQMEAFILKVGQDLTRGLITQAQADYFTAIANEIINDLLGQ